MQVVFVAFFIALGAIVNAQLFGELAMIVSAMNLKNTRFQEKMDTAQAAMKNISLPEKTQIQIQKYLGFSQRFLDSQNELERFMEMISPALRTEVIKHIFSKVLMKNEIF